MLLAASLRKYLSCDYELVAAIPTAINTMLSAEKLTLMRMLEVNSVAIHHSIDPNYPIANKVAALGIETTAEMSVFLDSDILCLSPFQPEKELTAPFNAKPADLVSFTHDPEIWRRVYDLFQLALPHQRMIATVAEQVMLPYFNSGVIAVQQGNPFAKVWEESCQLIDAEPSIPNKRPWLDQIALPIAVARLNLSYRCLDERHNYPLHLKPLPTTLPYFCHYHWPTVIRREPILNQLVKKLVYDYPPLRSLLLTTPEWANLLEPYHLHSFSRKLFTRPLVLTPQIFKSPFDKGGKGGFVQKAPLRNIVTYPVPDAIITGIPRSGTSHLCRLLHTFQDCIVINEPQEIFAPLTHDLKPWGLATFYRELRRDILDGRPIENKLHQGQLIEDTSIVDTRTFYQPQVSRPDFLLGTKNTLAYMARLTAIKQVLPHALIIACIRHPFDTMASWKTSFPHLKHATVTHFPVGHVNDPFLPAWQRHRLAEIAVTTEDALKRALLWRYLAECLLTDQQQLTLVRYEELVQQPIKVLKAILKQVPYLPPLSLSEKIEPSKIRQKREVLDDQDRQALGDICSRTALELGYEI
ncbi:MAG: hypothetical protein BWK79_07330 [Beggiatoa sp. IS2]|nr:MAG: hypothetical protein BWK79_07330 [Beggiatoa sp. IS2]